MGIELCWHRISSGRGVDRRQHPARDDPRQFGAILFNAQLPPEWSDLRFEPERVIDADSVVVALGHVRGTVEELPVAAPFAHERQFGAGRLTGGRWLLRHDLRRARGLAGRDGA